MEKEQEVLIKGTVKMSRCGWCKKESTVLREYRVAGSTCEICPECVDAYEKGVCISCGEGMYGEVTINGLCNKCQQVIYAKAEKYRNEILNGLGIEALMEMTETVKFTEKDYEDWMMMGAKKVSPKAREKFRDTWVKMKLIKNGGWTLKEYKDNIEDIKDLIDNNTADVFKSNTVMVLKDKIKEIGTGVNLIAVKNNVLLIQGK